MHKLLIVDDSSTMRRIFKRILRQADVPVGDIVEAGSAVDGLACLKSHPDIGLVLSDLNMPEMDGVEFVKAVRTRRDKLELPVIVVGAESGRAEVDTALAVGANAYVLKPFTPESLREVLGPFFADGQ